MPPLPMSFACGLYDRMVPIATGEVQASGISLNFIEVQHPRDIFDRMAGNREYDASELSSSEYITQYGSGDRSFVALPVFPSRAFRHGCIAVNAQAVKQPSDLNGKRIGVPLYTMTAAVWIRGLLQHEYNVDLSTIEWVEGSMEGPGSYGRPSSLPPLKPVKISRNETSKSLSQLLEDGDIDATISPDLPGCLGRAPHIRRLFPDFKNVEQAYFKKTGIFPIMHLVVLRQEFYQRHRFAATSLYNALNESKNLARTRMNYTGTLRYMLPWLPAELSETEEFFGGDCWPYGLEANRKTLEVLVQFLVEQSMIEKTIQIEELFEPVRETNFKVG